MDGVLRRRGGVLERLLHHQREPVLVRVGQNAPDRVQFAARARTRAAAAHGIERMRFALGVQEDLGAFRRRFASDPLIGRSVRRRPWLRITRRPEPFEALAWAICEQLIEYERAAAIERRVVAALGRRWVEGEGVDSRLRDLPAPAVLAGTADMGRTTLAVPSSVASGVQQCYPVGGNPSLVQLTVRGRLVTILGTGAPLSNNALASQGNAALAIDLMPSRRIVWLVPPPAAAATAAGPTTFYRLVPLTAYLIAIQLGVALLLAVAWRARRLGPLVAEPLPVVVRAAETAEGHARLYQSRRARARAAEALRDGVVSRLSPRAGLPAGASQQAVVAALAPRSPRAQSDVAGLLYGPPPESDRALVDLARNLDELEREVGTS